MRIRHAPDLAGFRRMTSAELRESFLIGGLFEPGFSEFVYSSIDRAIVGSVVPGDEPLRLEAPAGLASGRFTDRREIGVLNIGHPGVVSVEGADYALTSRDALYIGKGSGEIAFQSIGSDRPARFYLVSYPAHAAHPTAHVSREQAEIIRLGAEKEANARTMYKYISPGIVPSCQLAMGFTELAAGSVWNTMPCHTHERRSEIYLYFNLDDDAVVFHFLGAPSETRHIVVRNGQAVLAPSWSIHCGVGTRRYCFAWSMGGEDQEFRDADGVGMEELA